mmetsp:Transcript_42413/g.101419  ORF Transcript_42413/g.101419 Transcript_42413/m.101419 type:complete len:476 (-) Transcript_42413:273-1700(-)
MTCQTTCVAVVDPVTTGGTLAAEFASRGHAVIAVWSKDLSAEMRAHAPANAKGLRHHADVEERSGISETADAVRSASSGLELLACVVGAETGVGLADALSEELGLRTNGTQRNRRNKSVQQQCVKAAGLRAVREAAGTAWSQVKAFAESETMPVVVKPVESAGSEGVKLCHSIEEAEAHFHLLMGAQRKVGSFGAAVLVQEYLQGKEYVVDHVSHNGVHKTVMVWVYDKRPCNGANFVYFGTLPVPADSEIARVLIEYTRGVLDALGIRNGPSHGEVMMTADGPCLVEMNCRCHGGDGTFMPLARALTGGYSQVDATADAFLDEEAFNRLPDVPPSPLCVSGQEVCLVCMRGGTVASTEGLDQLCQLQSFVSLDTGVEVGSEVSASVDLFTSVGSLILMHPDREVFEEDLRTVRQMETECALFELRHESSSASEADDLPAELSASTSSTDAEEPFNEARVMAALRGCSEKLKCAD